MDTTVITPEIVKEHGVTEYEYDLIKQLLGREPNINELGVFSVMWSEHCGYKNTKPLLKTLPTKGKAILQGPGENAGVVDIGGGYAVVFKIESHNHPSAIEPYQGAATGVGGILRDIFTMGARPIACLDALRFGKLDNKRTAHLTKGVVKGIGDYGNCVGIPTIAGDVYFDESYQQNILVNAMCVGLIEKSKITTARAKGKGNLVVYYGSTTGRDGVHGATFASVELSEEENAKRGAVQVGDPFTEKLLMEATLELIDKQLLVAVQDMGAAGLTSSSSEMAGRGGVGIEMNLDAIPKRADDLTPYEMLLSESQERMLAIVTPDAYADVEAVLKKWDLNCVVVGRVVEGDRLTVSYQGEVVADIPVSALTDATPLYTREAVEPAYFKTHAAYRPKPPTKSATEIFKALLDSPTIASKRWVYEQYDYMVGASTVVRPGEAGAGVVRIRGTNRAIAMSVDGSGRYSYLNPYRGAANAIAEAYRNVIATGAMPLAVTNNLNFANPEKPDIYWQLTEAIRGMKDACSTLGTPITGGNCSMYNETGGNPIYPTVIIGMVGVIEDTAHITNAAFKNEYDAIYLIGETKEDLGATEYLAVIETVIAGDVPEANLTAEKRNGETVLQLIRKGIVNAASDISEGGLAITVAEMAFMGNKGANIAYAPEGISATAALFGETGARYVVGVPERKAALAEKILRKNGVLFTKIGVVGSDTLAFNDDVRVPIVDAQKIYEDAIPRRLSELD